MNTVPETSIFTKIINREIPAHIVYEDDTIIAFLTIEPINPGHTLVVPKIPFVNIFDGHTETLGQMMQVAQKISQALVESKLAEGVNLIMNNGETAGQEVWHAHLHVVPRLTDDQSLIAPKHVTYEAGQAATLATLLEKTIQK
jgi:histidine triad (HIT) family protein